MKAKTIKGMAERILSGLKFNYLKEDDSVLGQVDFGVLTVAMMVAALDGTILPTELAAFTKLAKQCRVSDAERAVRYESALHAAGYILLVSRSGISEKGIVAAFVREAEKVLPMGFAGGRPEDVRRALVIWTMMGMSDGDFCGIERKCVEAFREKVVEIMRRHCKREENLWLGLRPFTRASRSTVRKTAAPESMFAADFLSEAEKLVKVGDLAVIRKFIIKG